MKKKPSKTAIKKTAQLNQTSDALYERIALVIRTARTNIVRAIDVTMVKAYWHIGSYIVEEHPAHHNCTPLFSSRVIDGKSTFFE